MSFDSETTLPSSVTSTGTVLLAVNRFASRRPSVLLNGSGRTRSPYALMTAGSWPASRSAW